MHFTSGLLILIHGIVSFSDATSYKVQLHGSKQEEYLLFFIQNIAYLQIEHLLEHAGFRDGRSLV